MNISFDFDGVLNTEKGIEFLDSFIHANLLSNQHGIPFNIFIITTRYNYDNNEDILRIVQEKKIPLQNLIFTNGDWKWRTLEELGIGVHIDDNPDEVHLINENCEDCQAMLFGLNIHRLLNEGTEL